MWRILTERKNKVKIEEIVGRRFEAYTTYDATGVWQGLHEASLVIEIDKAIEGEIYEMAREIKELNAQEAVLVQFIESHSELV